MKNIPFPNPHDADALNDYLDALAAGKQVSPEDEVQTAAAEMRALANRHMPSAPEQIIGVHTGGETVHTAAYSPPISNRTRRARATKPKTSRLEPWLSGLLVAGLLVSMIGYTWWNGPGGGDENENLAWAPQTASPMAEDEQFVWAAPISPRECPDDETIPNYDPDNPASTLYTQEDYDQVSADRSYEIVGPAEPETANAVITRIRQSDACQVSGKNLPWISTRYEYENRTSAGRESLESIVGQRSDGSSTISGCYEDEMGLTTTDMYVNQDPEALDLQGNESLEPTIAFNPDQAVEFADGRIGIIPSVVSYDGEPAGSEDSVPVYMLILVNQDGEWMLDEKLGICIGECPVPMATPAATPEM